MATVRQLFSKTNFMPNSVASAYVETGVTADKESQGAATKISCSINGPM
jgi:hypothetical protein